MIGNVSHLPIFNISLFSLFWALQIFVSKVAFEAGENPVSFTIQAGIVALFVLAIYILPRKGNEFKNLSKGIIAKLLVANAVHFGLGIFFCNAGTALTSAINAGFLVKFGLVTTTLLALFFLHEKMTISKMVAVLTMLVGSYFISTKGNRVVPQPGDALILLACLCWSAANVSIRKILKDSTISDEIVTLLRPVAGIPLLVVFVFLAPLYPEPIKSVFQVDILEMRFPFLVAANGLFLALLFLFLNRTLKVASASYMTMMSMITPIVVSILAVTILKEEMKWIQVVGATLIISSGVATHYLQIDKQ